MSYHQYIPEPENLPLPLEPTKPKEFIDNYFRLSVDFQIATLNEIFETIQREIFDESWQITPSDITIEVINPEDGFTAKVCRVIGKIENPQFDYEIALYRERLRDYKEAMSSYKWRNNKYKEAKKLKEEQKRQQAIDVAKATLKRYGVTDAS